MTDQLDSFGLRDPNIAMRMKKVVQMLAADEVNAGPGQLVARAISVNLAKLKADVWVPGDPEPISVNLFPATIPNDVADNRIIPNFNDTSTAGAGSLVIIEDVNGKPYITRVLSGGQFSYDLGAAGLAYKIHNTSHEVPEQWDNTPQVSGTFGKVFSFFLPSNKVATRVGPFVALGNGSALDGLIRITLSRYSDTTTYECEVHDNQMWDSVGSQVSWMRMLPKKSGRYTRDSEIAVDMGILRTSYRDPEGFEFWLRFIELGQMGQIDFTYVCVEAFGPIINIGDPNSGRLLVLDYTGTPTQIGGYFGFHDSQHGMRNRFDEAAASDAPFTTTQVAWSSGSYDDSPTRLAEQLLPLWGCTGEFTWNGSRIKWTNSLIFSGVGPSHYGLTKGRLNVPMPASGTKIPKYPSEWTGSLSSVTVLSDSNGIPLAEGDTLYFGIPPGMGHDGTDGTTNWHNLKWLFFIVDSETYWAEDFNYKLPQWAIPIARRGVAGEQVSVRLTSHSVELIDTTQYQSDSRTDTLPVSDGNFSNTNTEVVSMTTPGSITFKNGCAYRVRINLGFKTSVNTFAMVTQLKKGTTTGGTTIFGLMRSPTPQAGQVTKWYIEQYITNTTGADITTQVCVTHNLQGPSGTYTWQIYGSAGNKTWMEVEYAGPASKYSTVSASIT